VGRGKIQGDGMQRERELPWIRRIILAVGQYKSTRQNHERETSHGGAGSVPERQSASNVVC
jgi:hypothetical protein